MEKGCDTCLYFDDFEGDCRKGMADQWQCRGCDTSDCPEWKPDSFWDEIM